ncbi:hypothetical protein EDD18DRAFT_1213044, partial [Armillaria luteobubalina]
LSFCIVGEHKCWINLIMSHCWAFCTHVQLMDLADFSAQPFHIGVAMCYSCAVSGLNLILSVDVL